MNAQIERAVEHFRALLEEQLRRVERMESASAQEKAANPKTVVGIVGGDGIGPIIVNEAARVLEVLLADEIARGTLELRPIDGLTIENRLARGEAVPAEVLAAIKGCDVLLKGPTATPKGGTLESANVTLRRALDLYANVRPVRIPEEGVDWTFFRENTEGEYALGSRGVELPGLAMDFKVITDAGTRRIARAAFEYARKNGKKNVAIVTKANIMKKTDGKFTAICHEVAKDYPEMEVEDWYIDIMTANLVNPAIRSRFEVFILPNLYGDIITDEAAQLQGGVGTAGSANLGDRYAMFEAIHGTAPRMLEEGLGDYANPESILRAAQMLLNHIGRARPPPSWARRWKFAARRRKKWPSPAIRPAPPAANLAIICSKRCKHSPDPRPQTADANARPPFSHLPLPSRLRMWYNGAKSGREAMESILRKWRMEDKYALAALLNDRAVLDNLRDGIPFPYTVRDAEAFIAAMLAADREKTFAFAIVENDVVIGSIALYRGVNVHFRTAELGYYLGRAFWGRGYATRAVRQACSRVFADTDILRIYAEPFARNAASCRVLEKAGFQLEGTLRKNAVKNGEVLDMKLYALVREEDTHAL